MHFAIADWDGDQRPDLAFVELERRESATDHYSIRFRFGTGTEARIGVDAPLGGLRLAARDVNGDDKVDLIVTSDLGARVVEVLLNDGHGKFSVAEVGAYDAAAADPDFFLEVEAQSISDQISLAQFRSTFEGEEMGGCANGVLPSADSVTLPEILVSLAHSGHVRSGRAPPLPAFLS